jgi:hypothetical protein
MIDGVGSVYFRWMNFNVDAVAAGRSMTSSRPAASRLNWRDGGLFATTLGIRWASPRSNRTRQDYTGMVLRSGVSVPPIGRADPGGCSACAQVPPPTGKRQAAVLAMLLSELSPP